MLSAIESVYGTSFYLFFFSFFFLILLQSALKLGILKLIFQVESTPNNLWNMKIQACLKCKWFLILQTKILNCSLSLFFGNSCLYVSKYDQKKIIWRRTSPRLHMK